jgi:D-inositol-3-phosphate glycosyltransferase
MKITFATTWNARCGIAVYSRSLVAELRKKARVEIVSLDADAAQSPVRIANQLDEGDVAHIQHQYPFFGGMAFYRNSFRRAIVRLKRPLVVTVHELDLGDDDLLPMRIYKGWFNTHLFGGGEVDRFIVHTADYRERLERMGIRAADIRVIPEGAPAVDAPAISAEDAKAGLGLAGRRVLTIFGFVVRRKGYEVALDALHQLPGDVSLVIAGGCHPEDRTGFYDSVKARVEAMGLSKRVLITDYLPDEHVPTVMAATDIVLAPFTDMSNSGSLLRAIAYQKPIVASDLPATREINARRQCLTLARAGDSCDLADKVRGLLDNEWMRTTAISAVGSYAAEFSIARIAEETLSVYEELLD